MKPSDLSPLAMLLDSAPILSRFSSEAKARLLPMSRVESLAPGDVLFKIGDAIQDIFLVLEGEIDIARQHEASVVGAQCYLGEEAALGCARYMSSAAARGPARVLRISHHALAKPLANNPSVRRDLWLSLVSHFADKMVSTEAGAGKSVRKDKSDTMASLGWVVSLLLPAAVLAGGDSFGLTQEFKMFLAIMCATVAMWIFRLVPEFVPGFFALLSIIVLGLAPMQVILSGFSSPGFFMAMSVLGMSAVVITSGLSLRILLLLLRYTPHNQFCYELNLLAVGILLTPIVPTGNGRVALTTPLLADMLHTTRCAHGGRAATRLSAAAFTGSTLFSGIFLTSKSANFVVFGLMSAQLQEQFQWLYWLYAGSVSGIVMLIVYLLVSQFMFRNKESLPLSNQVIDMQLKVLGPMSMKEWAAAAGVVLFGIAVATSSIHKLGPAWLALTVLYGLMLFNFLRPDEFRESVDWPFLMFLGGLVGLVNAMLYMGVDKALGAQLAWTASLMHDNLNLFILTLTGIILAMRFVLPINLTMVICATIFMPIANLSGINPWFVGFIILTIGECWFFAYQNASYTLFKKISDSPYDERNFLILNVLTTIIKLVGIYASIPFWRHLGIL